MKVRDTERGFKLSVPLSVPPFLGGGGGGFYSSGRSGTNFDGSIGDRGEGGMGFLQGGVGGRAKTNNIMGGFGGGGGAYGKGGLNGGGGGGYSGGGSGGSERIPVGVEVDPTILERVKKMNAVSMKLGMVR